MAELVGYTTGVFDLFHVGHLNVLRRASEMCDSLVVGVTTDELCAAKKGKRPVVPFEERCQVVEAIRYVDRVVPQATYDKFDAWERIQFSRMFVGDDWKGTDLWNSLEVDFRERGVEIVYFPYTTHTSSTILRAALDRL